MSSIGWIFVGAAFAIGLLTGWFVWRRRQTAVSSEAAKETALTPERQTDAPPEAKLVALESEIKAVREMLDADTEERAELTNAISSLDEAIKRANGRLKLILKSVKRAKSGD